MTVIRPEAKLVIVEDSGHTLMEPGTAHAALSATDAFR